MLVYYKVDFLRFAVVLLPAHLKVTFVMVVNLERMFTGCLFVNSFILLAVLGNCKEDILLIDASDSVAYVYIYVIPTSLYGNDKHASWLTSGQDHLQGSGHLKEETCDSCLENDFHFYLIKEIILANL